MAGSYIPLYRKYRPQSLDELIGQESIVKTLFNAIELGKIAHAYLFTGPRGTGKTSSARIFAKSLNCAEGPTPKPCGKCPSCIDITNSNSVDVIEIDAASNRKVEDARNLLEKIQFVPVSGKYKIYIIDEVHMLTTEAFNTLLKTLEEPPENLVFILATTEAHKVLNTIISRCQRFDFRRISQEGIIRNLKEIAGKEGINIEDKAISLIAKKSYGGMRDALGLLDQSSVLSNLGKEITESDIFSLLGSLSEEVLFNITNSLAYKDVASLMSLIDKVVQSCEPVNVIRELINYFRDILIIRTCDDIEKIKPLISLSESVYEDLKNQAEQFEPNEIVQIIEKLSEYERLIRNASQQHLWLEVALISICHRQDIQILRDMEERIARIEGGIPAGSRPIPPVKPALPPPRTMPERSAPAAVNPMPERPAQPVVEKPVQTVEKKPATPPPVEEKPIEKPAEPVMAKPVEPTPVVEPAPVLVAEPAPTAKEPSGEGIADLWKQLLSKNLKMPSQSFFMNLGKPVEISAKRIVITFSNENFVKEAQKEAKFNPIKDAAQEIFGTSPNIIIRTPMPEDGKAQTIPVKIEKPVAPPPPKPVPVKQAAQISVDTESHHELEEEVKENLDEMSKPLTPVNVSDQAKMVIDVFNGKVIE